MNRSKKQSNTKFSAIDIDETTNEPKIVELSQDEYEKRMSDDRYSSPTLTISDENYQTVGKQMVMNKVFGVDDKSAITKRQKFVKTLTTVLFFVLVIGVLAWTAYNDFFAEGKELPPKSYLKEIFSYNWKYLLFAVISLFGCYLFKALKHSLLSFSLRRKPYFGLCFDTAVVGLYYNYITPLAVGGQPFEIYTLNKGGFSGGEASSMTLSSFIMHQIMFVLCGLVSLALFVGNTLKIPDGMYTVVPKVISIIALVGLILAFSIPVFATLFSLNSKIGEKIVSFVVFIGGKLKLLKDPAKTKAKTLQNLTTNSNCIKKLATNPPVFILMFIMSALEHLSLCSIAYFVLKFFGFNWNVGSDVLEWLQVVQLCFILYAAISFIPTPGNAGAADLSFYLLFDTGLGISGGNSTYSIAFTAMVVWRLLSFYGFIIIGFIRGLIHKRINRKKQKNNVITPSDAE